MALVTRIGRAITVETEVLSDLKQILRALLPQEGAGCTIRPDSPVAGSVTVEFDPKIEEGTIRLIVEATESLTVSVLNEAGASDGYA